MSTHPYIPLYVDDFEAATAHLTIEEDGVYNRLLRLCWRTPGCSLPNDPNWIARKIRVSAADFDRVAMPVLNEFFKVYRGRLVQRRLKVEYDDISRKKSARQSAGKRGGDAKARKAKENAPSNASDLLPDTGAYQTQNQNHIEDTEDKSSAEAVRLDPDAAAWKLAKEILWDREGLNSDKAGSFYGKLLSRNAIRARDLLPALNHVLINSTPKAREYLTKAAERIGSRPAPGPAKRVGFV